MRQRALVSAGAMVVLCSVLGVLWLSGLVAQPGTGTVLVLASSRNGAALPAGPVTLDGRGTKLQSATSVPAAPQTRTLAQLTLRPGTYHRLRVGVQLVAAQVQLSAGQVTPLLISVDAGRVADVAAGDEQVNLLLGKLSGRLRPLPNFSLVDQQGARFTNASLAGKTVLLAAFHTTCRETCPLYSGLFLQLQKHLGTDSSVRLVEITTDPARDSPAVLRRYAASIGAHWKLVTGDVAELARFWEGLGVALSSGDSHASLLAIVGPDGYVRTTYQGAPDLGGRLEPALLADLNVTGRQQLRGHGSGWGVGQVLDEIRSAAPAGLSSGGGPAPDFVLPALQGDQVTLDRYRGRAVVISFWASWCAPCRAELPRLESAARQHHTALLLVDERDDPTAAKAMIAELHLRSAVGEDPDGTVAALYRVNGLPATAFVRADGSIETLYVGELSETAARDHLDQLSS